jgi:hypothetical protein
MKFAENITLPNVRRMATSYLAAVAVTYVAASLSQSLLVLTALARAGADISIGEWLWTLVHDLYGFTFSGIVPQGLTDMAGFIIALPVAALIHKWLGISRWILYPLAGATAMGTILYIVKLNFYGVPLYPGTRGVVGFGLQLTAGAVGGMVFAALSKHRS